MIMKSGYNLFAVFSFDKVLRMCHFIFPSVNERMAVIKQSIIFNGFVS